MLDVIITQTNVDAQKCKMQIFVASKTVITKEKYSLPFSLSDFAPLMMCFFTPYHCFCMCPAIMLIAGPKKIGNQQHLICHVCRSAILFLCVFSNSLIQSTLVTFCRFEKWRRCKTQTVFVRFMSWFMWNVLNMP